ncbi:NAD-binding protein [Crossiella sp. CA-258035]|uniref:NAD(P)-binding protein n=1 Tax=Crossiella sp. CA-258035 TaxID=2981138 RepID=UPI0024BCAA17|nr:NAD(P)-binding protein [Crossiella sp. CA-258035]WHT20249.1 NAD-binding protein [Crossiella sp. CA-258035]
MPGHTILIGYTATGRYAASVLAADRQQSGLVVVDHDAARLALAEADGVRPVLGNGSEEAVLHSAMIGTATHVVVTMPEDSEVARITRAARDLNRSAVITAAVHDPRWRQALLVLGADQVLVTQQVVGSLLGMSVLRPDQPPGVQRVLTGVWMGLGITERPVRRTEIDRPATECGPLVLAVCRGGSRLWLNHPQASPLRASDRLLVLRPARGPT